MTQAELAKRLQKPQSFVSKYENGDHLIDLLETYQIYQALNYSFTKLTDIFELAVNDPPAIYKINTTLKK